MPHHRSHFRAHHRLCYHRGSFLILKASLLSTHSTTIQQLAISAWLVAKYEAHNNYPSIGVRDRTRFLLFTSSWTIFFSMFYLILFLHSASTGSIMTSVASHLLLYVFV